jgi:hypothetical protein
MRPIKEKSITKVNINDDETVYNSEIKCRKRISGREKNEYVPNNFYFRYDINLN